MKKQLTIILMCLILFASFACANAVEDEITQEIDAETPTPSGFTIAFNGEVSEHISTIRDDTHYVPLRKVFEKMGAFVFYRNRDKQILALSHDGHVIRHIVGDNKITVDDVPKPISHPSLIENGVTLISVDALLAALCPDGILFDNQQLNIQFTLKEPDKMVKDVLNVCKSINFYPERFKRYINYHAKKPASSMQDVIFMVNFGLDYPFYENINTVQNTGELLVFVNKHNRLPEGFEQKNLVNMNRSYTVNDGKKYQLSYVAYEKYVQMAEAARKEGLSLRVVSAYRTEDFQRRLYNENVRRSGQNGADKFSARPGHSEHQTGLAVDINTTKGSFEYTKEFKWLQEHAHEYGFILRYPKGKEWITGYAYEPWHYRYIGTHVAKIIHDEGITYEQYYAKYIAINEFR